MTDPLHYLEEAYPRLLGDVGGTNARFAIMYRPGELAEIRVLACAAYPGIREAIAAYLAEAGVCVRTGVIAIANPVSGDEVRMTNHHWSFSVAELTAALGFRKLLVVNDFEALAMSIPVLHESELRRLGAQGIQRRGVIGVIGPGTGLGVAYLVPLAGGWLPLATEGGHVSLAPATPRQSAVLEQLRSRYSHISAERLLSGQGLPLLYQTLCELDGAPFQPIDSAQLVERALDGGEPRAVEAFSLFSHWLGSVAGNLALSLGAAGGIYLGGGVIARLGRLFDVAAFRDGFEAKGRFAPYLRQIPTWLITAEFPALIGAAGLLDSCLKPGQPQASRG